jgi:hypothetical protein
MCAPEPGQIDERFDAGMMIVHDRGFQQPWCSITNAVKQVVE